VARPTVNLDALGALLDRALAHPLAQAAAEAAPATMAQIRAIRADLPAAASALEARAVEAARARILEELGAIERPLAEALARIFQTRAPRGRRLPAGKKKKKGPGR